MSFVCQICGANFENNVKSRDNFNAHLKSYADDELQKRKIQGRVVNIDPRATALHHEDNLKRMQMQKIEAARLRYERVTDPEDLLNKDLDDHKTVAAAAAAAAIPFVQEQQYDQDVAQLLALNPRSHFKDTDATSIGGKKSRSKKSRSKKSRSKKSRYKKSRSKKSRSKK
jgi:hypothetical protein